MPINQKTNNSINSTNNDYDLARAQEFLRRFNKIIEENKNITVFDTKTKNQVKENFKNQKLHLSDKTLLKLGLTISLLFVTSAIISGFISQGFIAYITLLPCLFIVAICAAALTSMIIEKNFISDSIDFGVHMLDRMFLPTDHDNIPEEINEDLLNKWVDKEIEYIYSEQAQSSKQRSN